MFVEITNKQNKIIKSTKFFFWKRWNYLKFFIIRKFSTIKTNDENSLVKRSRIVVFVNETTYNIFTKRKFSCWKITSRRIRELCANYIKIRAFSRQRNNLTVDFLIRRNQSINQRMSLLQKQSIVDFLFVFDIRTIFTTNICLKVETLFDKERNKDFTLSTISHLIFKLTNKFQNIKSKNFDLTFRFVTSSSQSIIDFLLFIRRHFIIELVTMINEFVSMTSKTHVLFSFDSLHFRNRQHHEKMNSLYTTIRK